MNLFKQKSRTYLVAHLLVVVAVMIIFKAIESRKIAALLAGSLFVLVPGWVVLKEIKQPDFKKSLSFWGAAIFLAISALPIFILRLANWGTEWSEISFMGISGVQMHEMSNKVFGAMLICYFADGLILKMKERRQQIALLDKE